MKHNAERWMKQAITLAMENVQSGRGGPFGAMVVKDNVLIATGVNLVTATNDPTAHAELIAIRNACQALGTFQLEGCEIYSSCEPCPMCLGAIYWARPAIYYYSAKRSDAARGGFDDAFIYHQLKLPQVQRVIPGRCLMREEGLEPFTEWARAANKALY